MSLDTKQLEQLYPKGTVVTCRVVRVEAFGVIAVPVDRSGVEGLVRPGEWDWGGRQLDLQHAAPMGSAFEAEVLGYGEATPVWLVLSRRLRRANPYDDFRKKHRVGQVTRGQVTLLAAKSGGVLVGLPGGVEGFVPRPELPESALAEDGFGLLAQDLIEAEIIEFEADKVKLSIRERLRRREQAFRSAAQQDGSLRHHPSAGPVLEDLSLSFQLQELAPAEVPPRVREQIHHVLIVENNQLVADSLCGTLELLGFQAVSVDSLEAARASLANGHCDLLVLDFNLTGEHGLELAREIKRDDASHFALFLTGAGEAEWAELRREASLVDGILQKPATVDRLLSVLDHLIAGSSGADDQRVELAFGNGQEAVGTLAPRALPRSGGVDVATVLAEARAATGADRATLLSYEAGPVIDVVAGDWPAMNREDQQRISGSSVGDVLRGTISEVFLPNAHGKRELTRLVEVLTVGGLAGVRLAHSDQRSYGLFVLTEAAGRLRSETPRLLAAAAERLSQALREERLEALLTESQGLLLTGFLADSLLHEVKNAAQGLGPFSDALTLLLTRHPDLAGLNEKEKLLFKRAAKGVGEVSRELAKVVTLFRNLVSGSEAGQVELGDTLARVVAVLRPVADQRHVTLAEPEIPPHLPVLRISPKWLDQALLNLVLNAIEHMGPVQALKHVQIVVRRVLDGDFPIQIEISDTGPGIHRVHQERIFEPFFSTKHHGTGLGLAISRMFIERAGGRLRLAQSVMFLGSTFVIELPREVML